jgi:hypothetical protein
MNSSGIKRGLATTAVSALAVAGIPFIASSASAATGDSITVASVGPARNGGDQGAVILLRTKGIDDTLLKVKGTNLTSGPNSPSQTITDFQADTVIANGTAGDTNPTDGLDEITVRVDVTTPNPGDTYSFAVYEDELNVDTDADGVGDAANDDVDASEARAIVSGTTAGVPTAVTVTPASQTAPRNVESGDYSLTYRDAAGRLTQLLTTESTSVAAAPTTTGATVSDNTIDSDDAETGVATLTATGTTLGLKTFNYSGPASATGGSFTLDVVESASGITEDEVDVVTAADGWDGFDGGTFGVTTPVRVDQNSIRIDIRDANPTTTTNKGATLALTVTGGGTIRFDGKTSKTFTTVLDQSGNGSITITPDAGTITAGATLSISGGGINIPVEYQRSQFGAVESVASSYVSAFGGSVDVTLRAEDQFGLPLSGVFLAVQRYGGVNADAAPSAKKATGADGTATFTLTDTKATPTSNAFDNVRAFTYVDQFDPTGTNRGKVAEIYYTADGQGAEFAFTVDGATPAGAAYDPTSVDANPLTDGVIGGANESILVDTSGGTPGLPVTVSADNGALVLRTTPSETTLAQGKASQTGVIGDDFRVIGTKTGLVTITVTSGGKTKTGQVSIEKLDNNSATARSITVSGPESAAGGDVVAFPVVVTDAFGNPVPGFQRSNLNVTVSGPGQFQDGDAVSNAQGVINLNVRLADNANSAVTVNVSVVGTPAQFGAAANQVDAGSAANSGPGLPASVTSATATISEVTDIAALEQAVEDAEVALANAEGALAVAQANLNVAQTELALAQAEVDQLKERKAELRKKLNKAKRNDNKQKAKTTRKKLRAVKRQLNDAKDAVVIAQAKVAAEQVSVDNAQTSVDAAEADLAEAQADLDEAQN